MQLQQKIADIYVLLLCGRVGLTFPISIAGPSRSIQDYNDEPEISSDEEQQNNDSDVELSE